MNSTTGEHTVSVETQPKPAPESLKQEVRAIMAEKGRLYAKIPHPDFADWPYGHDPKVRENIIEPHLEYRGGTALEIGCYLAAFSHWLAGLGYKVTAVERNPEYVAIGRQVRDLCGKNFEILESNFYTLEKPNFDVVLALNVFHHSLKREKNFTELERFLGRLQCKMMIFEPHDPAEAHMQNNYRKMNPEEFTQFVAEKTGLTVVEQIGQARRRKIFKLKRPASSN